MKERPTGQGGKKMAKYFELQQATGTGTFIAIVTDPIVENGTIRATKVGNLNGFSEDLKYTFVKCESAEIIVIGNAICTEIKNPFAE